MSRFVNPFDPATGAVTYYAPFVGDDLPEIALPRPFASASRWSWARIEEALIVRYNYQGVVIRGTVDLRNAQWCASAENRRKPPEFGHAATEWGAKVACRRAMLRLAWRVVKRPPDVTAPQLPSGPPTQLAWDEWGRAEPAHDFVPHPGTTRGKVS